MPQIEETYLGITDAAGETLVIVASDMKNAERDLYRLWRKTVYAGFQPTVKNFSDLKEWNGAAVKRIPMNKALNWSQQ